ncbi:MAG: ribosome biogenesis GTPase Der [Ectothiorhodospiraceae bacterium]|jgi:GTP-binding protein|nr:ribosome biogenesis GTPase Der [Ectothiorhodospiraceae bacterium]
MKPVIALVGRPNVGKSTLFNRLTGTRDALVADLPGLTRDRKYGTGRVGGFAYVVVDTGGLSGEAAVLDDLMARQTQQAIDEADVVLMLVDARDGITAADQDIAGALRRTGKPVFLVVNKIDGLDTETALADFHALGLGQPFPVTATHGRGVGALLETLHAALPESAAAEEPEAADWPGIRIAFIGRPNAGKSTLTNRILGEERVVVSDIPGTTRDSIFIPFQRDGQDYTLIDTAGVRRRARVQEGVEKFSVIKTLQAIDAAHVVVMVMDAQEGITDQDAHLLGLVLDSGRALVLAINKWDGLPADQKDNVRRDMDLRLSFLEFAEKRFISALHGTGVGDLFPAVQRAYASATIDVPTPELTRLLEQAVKTHQPPLFNGRRIKLRYAHQGGRNPPVIVIHGNQTEHVPEAYRRYLMNYFRQALKLIGTPLRLEFRTGENPYSGRRNPITQRQRRKRQRLLRHARR